MYQNAVITNRMKKTHLKTQKSIVQCFSSATVNVCTFGTTIFITQTKNKGGLELVFKFYFKNTHRVSFQNFSPRISGNTNI